MIDGDCDSDVLFFFFLLFVVFFFVQAEDGIRDLVRSRGLGDVYKRQRWKDGGRVQHLGAEIREFRCFVE